MIETMKLYEVRIAGAHTIYVSAPDVVCALIHALSVQPISPKDSIVIMPHEKFVVASAAKYESGHD